MLLLPHYPLSFQLANALFQTACRFEELIQLTWADCQRVGEQIAALCIKRSVFQDVPVCLSQVALHASAASVARMALFGHPQRMGQSHA
jgi:hypothetical protein